VLFPPVENKKILGILFNSYAFTNRVMNTEHESFTVMLGGSTNQDILKLTNDIIQKIILEELRDIFDIQEAPLSVIIHRWANAIPLYDWKLKKMWDLTPELPQGILLFGNYTGSIGIQKLIEQAHGFLNVPRA
jgi:oxygen-dependent protoporphyrinogen oxidase